MRCRLSRRAPPGKDRWLRRRLPQSGSPCPPGYGRPEVERVLRWQVMNLMSDALLRGGAPVPWERGLRLPEHPFAKGTEMDGHIDAGPRLAGMALQGFV